MPIKRSPQGRTVDAGFGNKSVELYLLHMLLLFWSFLTCNLQVKGLFVCLDWTPSKKYKWAFLMECSSIFLFSNDFTKIRIKKLWKKYCMEHQTLGRRVVCPSDPARQRIILKIVGFQVPSWSFILNAKTFCKQYIHFFHR